MGESSTPPRMPGEGMQQFYNPETFSDVQVLMLGRRPLASKVARKSVPSVYTFNAHKIILSAGSTKFADHFRSHPKDENTGNVCKVHLEDLYDGYDIPRNVSTAVLRFLYGLPLFPAAEGRSDGVVDPKTWYGLILAAESLGIPTLRTHAIQELEAYLTRLLVDESTGLLRNEGSVTKFVQAVQVIFTSLDERETEAREIVLRLCLKYYTELEKSETFCTLTDAHPPLLRTMLGYVARHDNALMSLTPQSNLQAASTLAISSNGVVNIPSPLSIFVEGPDHYFNSPELSDVTILVVDPRKHSGSNDSAPQSIYAHKAILAARSEAFRRYFDTHDIDTSAAIREVRSSDIYVTSTVITDIVLCQIYGWPWFYDYSNKYGIAGNDWHNFFDAADGFGVPSLLEQTVDCLEAHLLDPLRRGLSGDEDAMQRLAALITEIHETADEKETAAIETAAKLIWKHWGELSKHETFVDAMEECSGFFKSVLD